MFAKVEEEDVHLAAVIAIDNASASCESKFDHEAATGSDAAVGALWDEDGELCVDKDTTSNGYYLRLGAVEVKPSGLF